jgi:hypothetical protein
MTFNELKEWLGTLTEDQLNSEVTGYSSIIDESTPISVGFNSIDQMGDPLNNVKLDYPLFFLDNM